MSVIYTPNTSGPNVVTTSGGGGGGGGGDVRITDGSQFVSITDVGGKKSLDVNVTDISLSHANDSVRIGDGVNLATATVSGAKVGLDVAVIPSAAEKTIIDSSVTDTIYYGFAPTGTPTTSALWKIIKSVTVGDVITTTYADGNANYDNVWDNRASLTYL